MLFQLALWTPTVLMRAAAAKQYPLDETLTTWSDYQHFTRLATKFRFGNVPHFVLRERAHENQFHKRNRIALRQDARAIREQFFAATYPHASAAEQNSFRRLTYGFPFETAADLRAAGEWLAALAHDTEPLFRQRMALHWRDVCRTSAQLGMTSYRLYQTILPKFEIDPVGRDLPLQLACALRLAPNSRAEKIALRAAHTLRQKSSWVSNKH
jgi:hypothetical protein